MSNSDNIVPQVVSVKQFLALLPALDALEVTEQEAEQAASLMSFPSAKLSAVVALDWARETAATLAEKAAKQAAVSPASSRISGSTGSARSPSGAGSCSLAASALSAALAAFGAKRMPKRTARPGAADFGPWSSLGLNREDCALSILPRRAALAFSWPWPSFVKSGCPALASVVAGAVQLVRVVKACSLCGRRARYVAAGYLCGPFPVRLRLRSLVSGVPGPLRVAVGRMLRFVLSPSDKLRGLTPLTVIRGVTVQNAGQDAENKPQTPNPPKNLTMKLDYLNFTFKEDICPPSAELVEVERLKVLLGDAWENRERGLYRYPLGVACGDVLILWGGRTVVSEGARAGEEIGMGVHVQASGEGMRQLEARGVSDWRGWLEQRRGEGATFARVDTAFDVLDGSLTVEMFDAASEGGLVSSRFNADNSQEPVLKRDGQGNITARGFNFGNRASDSSVVIYDKLMEQAIKREKQGKKAGAKLAAAVAANKQQQLETGGPASSQAGEQQGPEPLPEQWLRVELRNRNDRATALVDRIIADGFAVAAAVLADTLDFKERGGGEQRCRWPSARWWLDFIAWAGKAALTLEPRVRTLEQGMDWLERQGGNLLVACYAAFGDAFVGWLIGLTQNKPEQQLPGRYRVMVAAHRFQCEPLPPGASSPRDVSSLAVAV